MPTISVNGAEIYYELAGSGPPVVLLHAGIADSRMWDGQFDAFVAAGHTVLRYDQRGYGRTAPTPGHYSPREDLRRLLAALGLERPALVGCSMGSRLALDFALRFPDKVERLVLTSPSVSDATYSGPRSPLSVEIDLAELDDDLARVNELEIQIWVDGPRRTPEQVAPWVRALALEMNAIALANEGIGREEPAQPVEARLHTLRTPTLIVVGEEDTAGTRATADWLMRRLSTARRVDLPGGHLLNMEQPQAYNAAVLGFLAADF